MKYRRFLGYRNQLGLTSWLKTFERKKIEYVHGPEGHTPFVLTNNAMQARDWSTETVAARQKGLLTVLADLWRLKVVDDTSRRLAPAPALPRSR